MELEEEQPHLLPMCAFTMSEGSITAEIQDSTPFIDLSNQITNKVNLIDAQKSDSSLAKYHHQAVKKGDIVNSPSFYYQADVLIRFYRPPHLTVQDTLAEKH